MCKAPSEIAKALTKILNLKSCKNHIDRIHLARGALSDVRPEDEPELWVRAAVLFSSVSLETDAPDHSERIEEAIRILKRGLNLTRRDIAQETLGKAQYYLGRLWERRKRGRYEENARRAIEHLQEACESCTRGSNPELWAEINHRLGLLHVELWDRADAIRHYLDSLEIYTRQTTPVLWAIVQSDLGHAFLMGDDEEAPEYAIQHLRMAIEVFESEGQTSLLGHAHSRLGMAYRLLTRGDRSANFESSIEHYRIALELFPREEFSNEWASVHEGLGQGHFRRRCGDRYENLEASLAHFRSAQSVFTKADHPSDWAQLERAIAAVYGQRLAGGRLQNLEVASAHYQNAYDVYTSLGQEALATAIARLIALNNRIRRALQSATGGCP